MGTNQNYRLQPVQVRYTLVFIHPREGLLRNGYIDPTARLRRICSFCLLLFCLISASTAPIGGSGFWMAKSQPRIRRCKFASGKLVVGTAHRPARR